MGWAGECGTSPPCDACCRGRVPRLTNLQLLLLQDACRAAALSVPHNAVQPCNRGPATPALPLPPLILAGQQGGRGGGGGPSISDQGRQLLKELQKEGLGDHILLLRLYEVGLGWLWRMAVRSWQQELGQPHSADQAG